MRDVDGQPALEHRFDYIVGHEGSHAIIDAPAGEDHLRVETNGFSLVGEIIRINTDAVAANQARAER